MSERAGSGEVASPAPATAERKVSDETLKRFHSFVRDRATRPVPYEPGVKLSMGLYDIKPSPGQVVPVNSIEYKLYEYEEEAFEEEYGVVGPDGQREDVQLAVGVSEDKLEIFGLFGTRDEYGVPTGISYSVGHQAQIGYKADEALVNGILTQLETMETEGLITPT